MPTRWMGLPPPRAATTWLSSNTLSFFGQHQFSLSPAFKASDIGAGGTIFRIHTALQIDVLNDGNIHFDLVENNIG